MDGRTTQGRLRFGLTDGLRSSLSKTRPSIKNAEVRARNMNGKKLLRYISDVCLPPPQLSMRMASISVDSRRLMYE